MLQRLIIIVSPSARKDAGLLSRIAALQDRLSTVASRTWPTASVETVQIDGADGLGELKLEAEDMLFVLTDDLPLLESVNADADNPDAEQPAAVLLVTDENKHPAPAADTIVYGTLRLDESVPDNVTMAINNALASRVRAAFMHRLKMRDARPAATPVEASQSTQDEWLPTQIVTRNADGQFDASQAPVQARGAANLSTDYGAKALGYNILSHLAKGGVADVYLAERANDGTPVVLKIIDRAQCDDPSALKRFIQEYTLVSRLRSPHVVQIFDRGFTPNHAFISMEYFPGGDLTRSIRRGISPETAVSYMKQIALGLLEIHRQGIVHRDMKPGNVLFREDGTAVITDFGIAKLAGAESTLTLDNAVVGTPYYTAPELILGQRCDIGSDLYSVGVMFFEMLTGRKPYDGKNVTDILSATVSAPIPVLDDALLRFQPFIEGLMAKNPAQRFRGTQQLLEALSDLRLIPQT